MYRRHRKGFTIIELMVALVVGGLLMAVLVGVAGSVQKTFGRTRDITELQANLRFAMRTLVQDLRRTAFMYAPDPNRDPHREGPVTSLENAITEGPLELRGNYVSSRDYRVCMPSATQARVLCRNGDNYCTGPSGSLECTRMGSYEPYLEPFNDGPGMEALFCENELVRLDTGDRHYQYLHIASVDTANLQINFQESVDRDRVKGAACGPPCVSQESDMHGLWINPVTTVSYDLVDGGEPPPYGSFGTKRWVLNRITDDCRDRPLSELVEFMLPPFDQEPDAPGLMLRVFSDANWGEGATAGPWTPDINFDTPADFPGSATIDWPKVRAVAIVLRARTEVEDANFILVDYPSAASKNFGYDLDQNEDNGLAHVRVESTMVQLRNMAIAQSPAKAP